MLESEILCGLPYLCQSQLLLQYRLVISYKFICIINFKFYYLLFIFLGSSKKNPRNSSLVENKTDEPEAEQEALLTMQLALPAGSTIIILFFYLYFIFIIIFYCR